MKQKSITLRKFIENFPLKPFYNCSSNIPKNFKNLTYLEKYELFKSRVTDTIDVLCIKDNSIFFGRKYKEIVRIGNKIFTKIYPSKEYIYIMPNKVVIKAGYDIYLRFLELCNIDWFRDIPEPTIHKLFSMSSIYRGILTKKIYSEETLYKKYASIYGIKGIDWRVIKSYCNKDNVFSISDLKDFTKDLTTSINIITQSKQSSIYYDLLSCAVQLNEIVDFSWSLKRINAEHQRQIRTLKEKEIKNKSSEPIYDNPINNKYIKQLNNELEVFMEGSVMHHCLYNCYWNWIKNKTYIAFHMSYPEDCTFGIRCGDTDLDQIFLKYDQHVKPETRQIASEFLKANKDKLLKMFDKRNNNINVLDIPF